MIEGKNRFQNARIQNAMWMELCTTWALHLRYIFPDYTNSVHTIKWRLMFCRCNPEKCVFDSRQQMRFILYTAFNGTSADPGGILCAGLVVSPWIAYEIFESPERCMMNEVACYLYAYRAHWLATGSAKGNGSKWNSPPGQYIIKRNVCTRKLQAFFRCGQGAWRGGGSRGEGGGGGGEKAKEGEWGRVSAGWVRSTQEGSGTFFCWISSIFILADLCLLTISLQPENESTRG